MARQAGPVGASWLPETCSSADLAVLFGISTRVVRDWDQKGVLVRAPGKGRFRTRESINAYLKSIRDQAAGRKDPNVRTLSDERAEDVRIGRQIKEMKLAQLRGDVLTVDEVSESWSTFAASVRAAVLSIPGKARSSIPHLTAHDGETLKRECRNLLIDLAEEVEAIVLSGDAKKLHDGK